MTWVLTAIGVLLVLVALRDIYATLWHPRGLGRVSRVVFTCLWRAAHTLGRRGRFLGSAGPIGLLCTAIVWAALVVVGWALVYLPHMPEGFYLASPLDSQDSSDPVVALYLSLVTVATLGFGDVTPEYSALRLLMPLQALIGFVLFTAAISWVLQVYPALVRRRATARQLALLEASGGERVAREGDPSIAFQMLYSVTDALATADMDLAQYEETYYFRDSRADISLAATASYALRLADAGAHSDSMEVRTAADMLAGQAGRLAQRYASILRTDGSSDEIYARVAADHRYMRGLDQRPAAS